MKILKTSLRILLAPICVFLFHLILLLFFQIYDHYPWFDMPMHFVGGAAISISALLFIKVMQKGKYLGKSHPLIIFIFVISLVALTAVLWEFLEFIVSSSTSLNMQPSLPDTMLDFLLGLVGGAVGFLTFQKRIIFQ